MTGPTCHRSLRRYWFPLEPGLGIGVTAASEAEARALAEEARRRHAPASALGAPVADVALDALDPVHVLPHIGPVVVRGVWFPALDLQP